MQAARWRVARLPLLLAAPAAAAPAPPRPSIDLEALMLTWWPRRPATRRRCSALDMELEADLGIDSIKRVEILSAMRERAPNLPEVKPTELATLRTLGQIVDYMRRPPAVQPAPRRLPRPAAPAAVEPERRSSASSLREVPSTSVGWRSRGVLGARRVVVTDDGAGVAPALVRSLASAA